MATRVYRDKKFTELEKELAPQLRKAGQHLVAVRRYKGGGKDGSHPITLLARDRNRRSKPAYVHPAAPIVDGVRMRWQDGKLVPRVGGRA